MNGYSINGYILTICPFATLSTSVLLLLLRETDEQRREGLNNIPQEEL